MRYILLVLVMLVAISDISHAGYINKNDPFGLLEEKKIIQAHIELWAEYKVSKETIHVGTFYGGEIIIIYPTEISKNMTLARKQDVIEPTASRMEERLTKYAVEKYGHAENPRVWAMAANWLEFTKQVHAGIVGQLIRAGRGNGVTIEEEAEFLGKDVKFVQESIKFVEEVLEIHLHKTEEEKR